MHIGGQVPDLEFDIYYQGAFSKLKFSDLVNKWIILLFYPADFTYVCPTELVEAAEYYEEFQKLNAEIVSISTDTMYVHKAWHDQSPTINKIRYPMAADPTRTICNLFGTYIEEEGLSIRATYIINPEGIVKAYDVHDNSIGRSTEEILRKLQASIFVREHNGEVCPASWKPGKKTLKKGIELVGKI